MSVNCKEMSVKCKVLSVGRAGLCPLSAQSALSRVQTRTLVCNNPQTYHHQAHIKQLPSTKLIIEWSIRNQVQNDLLHF